MNTKRSEQEARNLVARAFGTGELLRLGRGSEGPVFSDNVRVFKCLVDPGRWRGSRGEPVLRSLPGRLCGYKTFPEVLAVEETEGVLVVVSRYEPYEPEIGETRPEEWLEFLKESRDARIACRNVTPGNFVRVAAGIRLVDLGTDLRELTPGESQEMAVRAFLSFRFAEREDLRDLMRECLRRKDHPSLLGLEHFLAGLEAESAYLRFDKLLLTLCERQPGRKVLDFRIVLSCSRKGYTEAVWRQTTEEFIRALENAFWHFGGVPRTVVIDNLKAAVTRADWFDPDIHPKIEAFARHYGTVILPTKPRTPRHKGKIEAGVKYVQSNALKGRVFESLEGETERNRRQG